MQLDDFDSIDSDSIKIDWNNIVIDFDDHFGFFDDFEYSRIDSGIKIDRYSGSETSVNIPAQIDGLPVREIGGDFSDFGAFQNCRSLTSIEIPEGVTSIGYRAFSGCTSLESITIPKSVNFIGDEVFYECSSLTSITIPKGVTSIYGATFSGCRSLKSIIIPDSVTEIDFAAFSGCTSLEFVKIPNSVNSIGNNLFEKCDHLKWVYIKKSWNDKAINNIFGSEPSYKIFRTVSEVKRYLKETLNELSFGFEYYDKVAVLRNSLDSRSTADNTIMDIVAPAVNDLENLETLQKRGDYFSRVINLINVVSSVELTSASDCLQKLNQEKSFTESDLKTNVVALLMLENKLFTKNALPNPNLAIMKEAAQVLSRLNISF